MYKHILLVSFYDFVTDTTRCLPILAFELPVAASRALRKNITDFLVESNVISDMEHKFDDPDRTYEFNHFDWVIEFDKTKENEQKK